MNIAETSERIIAAYAKDVPEYRDVSVVEIVTEVFGGNLAVVKYRTDSKGWGDEICFVDPDGKPSIYETTRELARDLEQKAKAPLIVLLFTRPIMSGIVFVFLLVAVFIIGFFSFNSQALSILGSVVGVAARFFFGSGRDR